jgi:glycosyltransferase involved in cell wall biosynthesis
VSGRLVPVGDLDAMVHAAVELLQPERWRAARTAAVERAQSFSAERVVPRYEALYARVLEQ